MNYAELAKYKLSRREPAQEKNAPGKITHNRINKKYLVRKKDRYHLPKESHNAIATIVDKGSFEECHEQISSVDFLNFVDVKSYKKRIKEAAKKTGLNNAFVGGKAEIGKHPIMIGSLDFRFLGGSLGSAVGEKIVRLCNDSIDKNIPLILVIASGGARMQEGLVSLMQMAKISVAINRLKQNNIPYITVLTHPTTGGVTASFAMQGDIVISEPNSRIGFAGPRVIEQTIKVKIPKNFQMSEQVLKQGMLDMILEGIEIRETLFQIVKMLTFSQRSSFIDSISEVEKSEYPDFKIPDSIDYGVVRNAKRPRTQDYIKQLFSNFIELHGDRRYGDDQAITGGLAYFQGIPVMVIGHEKGKTPEGMAARNFGMPHPEGYRKAQRLMGMAEKFKLPVVTFIDTVGAYPGIGAEERGQSEAIASSLLKMSGLKVPIIAINIGEGGSGGALALGVGNVVAMLRSSIYSVISPEGCAAILFRDASFAEQAAKALKITAEDCYELKIIDEIIEDGIKVKNIDLDYTIYNIRNFIYESLMKLLPLSGEEAVQHRYERFAAIGTYKE